MVQRRVYSGRLARSCSMQRKSIVILDEHEFDEALYRLILRLSGRIDDESSALILNWLYYGEQGLAFDEMLGTLRTQRIPTGGEERLELERLAEFVKATPEDLAGVSELPPLTAEPELLWHFLPGDPAIAEIDHSAIAYARATPTVRQVWRAVRHAQNNQAPPHRVFIIEVDSDANAPYIAGGLSDNLDAVRRKDTSVSVIRPGDELSAYHRAALAHALPLWERVASGD